MRLTYEQMRLLSEIPPPGKVPIKSHRIMGHGDAVGSSILELANLG